MDTEITQEEALRRRRTFGRINDAPFHTMPYTSKFAPQKVEENQPELRPMEAVVDETETVKELVAV